MPLNISLLIPVHNALPELRLCINSILSAQTLPNEIIFIDDASDIATATYLEQCKNTFPLTKLLRNESRLGFTRSANTLLNNCSGELAILLNSDCIVPKFWIEKIFEAFDSRPNVGIVGCLSNAAGHFSVPHAIRDSEGWIPNYLPQGTSVDAYAELLALNSKKTFPLMPYVNGFCMAISQETIKTIGTFDEEMFPDGYGEEIDFCIRARNAGLDCVLADQLFVYHHKSSSYGAHRRRELSHQAEVNLAAKYGVERIAFYRKWITEDFELKKIREKLSILDFTPHTFKSNLL